MQLHARQEGAVGDSLDLRRGLATEAERAPRQVAAALTAFEKQVALLCQADYSIRPGEEIAH